MQRTSTFLSNLISSSSFPNAAFHAHQLSSFGENPSRYATPVREGHGKGEGEMKGMAARRFSARGENPWRRMKAEHTGAHPAFREASRGAFRTHYILLVQCVMRKGL